MSEQTSVSPCCVTGHVHEGTPKGSFQTINSLRTYVAKSESDSGSKTTVVFISDIFGVDLPNTQIVADEWARAGFNVLLPDFFEGDAVPHEHLKAIVPNLRDQEKSGIADKAHSASVMATSLGPWLVKHREAVARPLVEKFFSELRSDPNVGKIVAVGFCWGGRYSLLLANDDSPSKVDVAIAFHPSFLVEADVQNITSTPVCLLKGDKDAMMSDEALKGIENILQPKLSSKFYSKVYPDAVHGFTIRGDDMVASEKKMKEESNNEGIQFAQKWTKA